MNSSSLMGLIVGMAVVTYLPRFIPMLVLSNRQIPKKLAKWMSFIPVSIFAALVFSDVFFWNSKVNIHPLENVKLLPTLLVFYIAYKTQSLLWSMIFGIIGISFMVWFF